MSRLMNARDLFPGSGHMTTVAPVPESARGADMRHQARLAWSDADSVEAGLRDVLTVRGATLDLVIPATTDRGVQMLAAAGKSGHGVLIAKLRAESRALQAAAAAEDLVAHQRAVGA